MLLTFNLHKEDRKMFHYTSSESYVTLFTLVQTLTLIAVIKPVSSIAVRSSADCDLIAAVKQISII